jgi:hypothetical protein
MTPTKVIKRRKTKKEYRLTLSLDKRVADGLLADSQRKGIGVVDVIRIAASEYIDRLVAQAN